MKKAGPARFAWKTWVSALVYLSIVLLIGFAGTRQSISNYLAEKAALSGSISKAEEAIRWERNNPNAFESRGAIFLRNRNYLSAASDFEQAILLRENDYRLWLKLGSARDGAGNPGGAREAFERAVSMAPNYSQPNFQLGMFYLSSSRTREAFEFLNKAAEYQPLLYPEVLKHALIAFDNDPIAVDRAIRPGSVQTRRITSQYLIENGVVTPNVRSFLLSRQLSPGDRDGFVRLLIEKQNYSLARDVWLAAKGPNPGSGNDLVFDGGFEYTTASEETGFGWQIDQHSPEYSVRLDKKVFHSGSRSIRIDYRGNVETARKLVSQLVYVKPHQRYVLSLFARSSELVTAGPPVIEVRGGPSRDLLASSGQIKVTEGKWIELKLPFTTSGSSIITVNLVRASCEMSPCPIFGDLRLDDFRLLELGPTG